MRGILQRRSADSTEKILENDTEKIVKNDTEKIMKNDTEENMVGKLIAHFTKALQQRPREYVFLPCAGWPTWPDEEYTSDEEN